MRIVLDQPEFLHQLTVQYMKMCMTYCKNKWGKEHICVVHPLKICTETSESTGGVKRQQNIFANFILFY